MRIGPGDPSLGTVISTDSAYSVTVDGRGVVYGVNTVTEATPPPPAHIGEDGGQGPDSRTAFRPVPISKFPAPWRSVKSTRSDAFA